MKLKETKSEIIRELMEKFDKKSFGELSLIQSNLKLIQWLDHKLDLFLKSLESAVLKEVGEHCGEDIECVRLRKRLKNIFK